ncbi:MAG: peptide chain release factor-like protein [Akkermansia sp.]
MNKTESAVQIWHIPTGVYVRCEEERSQMKNREKGMKILRAKLFKPRREEAEKYPPHAATSLAPASKKNPDVQFPAKPPTDHRIGYTSHT